MKIIIFTTALFFLFTNLQSQTFDDYPNIIPPSPTAYELGKANKSNVGLFTGTIQSNIPIHTYISGDISIPISINYASNGIKVDQMETRVGLGWNLSVGGVISRVVRDEPDEENYGFFPTQDILNFQDPFTIDFFYKSGQGETDTESDLYNFNFCGYSGKFLLGNDKTIVQMPHSNLQIFPQISNGLLSYLIVTPDGTQYYFAETETNISRIEGSGHSEYSDEIITSWFLSKIVDYKGNIVYLEYQNELYDYYVGKNENLKIVFPDFQVVCNNTKRMVKGEPTVTMNRSKISSKFLQKIYSSNPEDGSIEFISNLNNPNSIQSSQKLLSCIKVIDKDQNTLQNFDLEYTTYSNKRTFLTKLRTLDPTKYYEFEYISPEGLPERLSYSQDYWGYFNNESNNCLYPKINDIAPFNLFPDLGANKAPSEIHSQFGLLKKIKYPTKGEEVFSYESNTYFGEAILTPASNTSFHMNVYGMQNFEGPTYNTDTYVFNIPFDQEIKLRLNVEYNSSGGCTYVEDKSNAKLKIINIETNIETPIIEKSMMPWSEISSQINENSYLLNDTLYAYLEAGAYKIELSASNIFCAEANLNVFYSNSAATYGNKNINTGGNRVQRISVLDPISQKTETNRFYYYSKDNDMISSGVKTRKLQFVSDLIVKQLCGTEGEGASTIDIQETKYKILNSSSLNTIYNDDNYSLIYK